MVGSIQTQSLHFGRISRNFFLFCNAKTDLIRSKNPVAGKFVRHLNSVLFNSLISQSRVLWLIAGMRSSSNFYCCARLITGRAIYYTVVSSREKGRASSSVFHYKFPSHFYSTNRFKLENFSPSPPPPFFQHLLNFSPTSRRFLLLCATRNFLHFLGLWNCFIQSTVTRWMHRRV